MEYLKRLNKEQYEAATTIDGRLFILAGAGSGKTATIVARVAYMLDNDINPENILLLTFTNKAANEMKQRITSMVGDTAEKITACTFHSFCANLLRQNASHFGFTPNYTILDGPDTMDAISLSKQNFLNRKKKEGIEYNLKDFPTTSALYAVYGAGRNNCQSFSDVIDEDKSLSFYREETLEIIDDYVEYKRDRNLLDYDDLLYYTEYVLSTYEKLRDNLQDRYKYVSCDEYQDTNTIQNRILNLLTEKHGNLAVVGDDNQSIYAFRFANIENILSFDKVYPDCKTVVLDTNYRSSQEILDNANAIMFHATEGKEKNLKGCFSGEMPHLVTVDDIYQEAEFVLDKIKNRTCKLKDIAVICRGASQSYILENRLNIAGIPYNKFGGLKFTEKIVIKNILAFLRVIVNVKDEIALYRLLQLYPGVGKGYAQKIAEQVVELGTEKTISKYKRHFFYSYLLEFFSTIEKLDGLNLEEQISFLVNEYYPEIEERLITVSKMAAAKKSEAFAKLKEDLEDAKNLVPMTKEYRSAAKFLEEMTLESTKKNADEDCLNITTIHSAKGLEYNTVFILDCIEGITPRAPHNIKENAEELRCFYVACTRAKKELYFMMPEYYNLRNIDGLLTHFLDYPDVIKTLKLERG